MKESLFFRTNRMLNKMVRMTGFNRPDDRRWISAWNFRNISRIGRMQQVSSFSSNFALQIFIPLACGWPKRNFKITECNFAIVNWSTTSEHLVKRGEKGDERTDFLHDRDTTATQCWNSGTIKPERVLYWKSRKFPRKIAERRSCKQGEAEVTTNPRDRNDR